MRTPLSLGLTRPAVRGINWGHPLAHGLKAAFLFDEGSGAPYDLAARDQSGVTRFAIPTGAILPKMGVGPAGACGVASNTASYWTCGLESQYQITSQCTILYIRRKLDATNRAVGHFGLISDAGNYRLGAHVPYSDGIVYWDFGIGGATQRLSVAGLPTQGVQKWGFVAGRRGMSIWLDGIRRANSTALVGRNISTSLWGINNGNEAPLAGGDLTEVYFVAILQAEWGAREFEEWNDNPYSFFVVPDRRRWYVNPAEFGEMSATSYTESLGSVVVSVSGIALSRSGTALLGSAAMTMVTATPRKSQVQIAQG